MRNMLNQLCATPASLFASLRSPAGKRARLSILIYHRVLDEPDPLTGDICDKIFFETQISILSAYFHVLPLPEAIERLKAGTLPSKAACITFDDGYADNAENALPILQKLGTPATFFIAAGFVDGGMMWNDKVIEFVRKAPGDILDLNTIGLGQHNIGSLEQRRQTLYQLIEILKYRSFNERHTLIEQLLALKPVTLPDNLMMTTDQIMQLHRAGMEIGSHTLSHPILARTANETVYAEIVEGKNKLENILQAPVRFFAYPNGKPRQDYLPEHVVMLRQIGFEAAFTTAWGAANSDSDIHQLPRFTPWNTDKVRFILRMVHNTSRTPDTVPVQ